MDVVPDPPVSPPVESRIAVSPDPAPPDLAALSFHSVGDAVTAALELERDRYELVLLHSDTQELVRTGVLVTMRDLEVLGSAAHFYSESYENPERRFPQVMARRERARRMGRSLWRFAVDRCGIEAADRKPSRASAG